MDGPTLNPKYNELLKFWNDIGEPADPECEVCGKDLANKKVIETRHGFLCTHCDAQYSGKPSMTNIYIWPTKGIFR